MCLARDFARGGRRAAHVIFCWFVLRHAALGDALPLLWSEPMVVAIRAALLRCEYELLRDELGASTICSRICGTLLLLQQWI